jgi:hypothetical protein
MKAQMLEDRRIKLTDIPGLDNEPMILVVDYEGDASISSGVALDKLVIPAIVEAINEDEAEEHTKRKKGLN